MDLDLEQYRLTNELTYEALAELIGVRNKAQARTYALGIRWPKPQRLEEILRSTGGLVTIRAMHRRHLAFVNSRDGESVHNNSVELMSG